MDIFPEIGYNKHVAKTETGGSAMNERDTATQWENRFDEAEREIANMDEIDFVTLLLESRIIQAS